jgi:hypothetical protein
LYNGEVEVNFTEKNHKYVVTDKQVDGGKPFTPPSVTKILKVMDKPALVQWSANMAADYLREKWQPGKSYDELEIKELLDDARMAHRKKADKGKDFGTLVHKYMEAFVRSESELEDHPTLPENTEAKTACEQITTWLRKNVKSYHGCEMLVYSRKYRIASMLDVMAEFNDGVLTLFDYKCASGVWAEYRLQLAAYANFYNECYGEMPQRRIVPWWDKKNSEFKPTELRAERMKPDFDAFTNLVPVQQWIEETKEEE